MKLPFLIRYLLKACLLGLGVALLLVAFWPALRLSPPGNEHTADTAPPVSYAFAARRAGPAVVNIYTRSFQRSNVDQDATLRPQSLGSGVILSAKGHILTNYHVIANADQVIVALQDGRIFTADLVGVDVPTDLAVLSITADSLPVIPQNPDLSPQVGDVVLAIGNPYNVGQTITQGIISATGRIGLSTMGPDSNGRQDLLQTDAAINSGNSGGALVNTRGELVGINSAAYHPDSNQESYGINFAIPYKLAHRIMAELVANGRVLRGYVGVSTIEVNAVTARLMNLGEIKGLIVESVDPHGPATTGGIQPGDVLIQLDDTPLQGVRSAMDLIAEVKPGKQVLFTVLREGKRLQLPITVAEDLRFQNMNRPVAAEKKKP